MFRCAGKFSYKVFFDTFRFNNVVPVLERMLLTPVWMAAFNCLKVSMPFVQDFFPLRLTLDRSFVCNYGRVVFIKERYHDFFGDGLRGGAYNPHPVVNPDDLFPPGQRVSSTILKHWLVSCVNSALVTPQRHPARCLGTLRLAGFFSTKATRSKLAISLRQLYARLRLPDLRERAQVKLIISFLIELNKQSFGFSNIRVDSRRWRVEDGMFRLGLHPCLFPNLVVDLREEDFDRLYLDFRTRHPHTFPVMSFGLTLPDLIQ